MDVSEAQDHLQMVDRILARTDDDNCLSPYPLVVWGLAGAVMNVVVQLVYAKQAPPALLALALLALVTGVVLTILWARSLRGMERSTLIKRQVGNAFTLAWIVAVIAEIGAAQIFPAWAQAALWVLMYGAAMLFVGTLLRNRLVFVGGAILLASLVVANFMLPFAGYVFALGELVGMTGTGLALYATQR